MKCNKVADPCLGRPEDRPRFYLRPMSKYVSAEQAVSLVKSGQRVFVHGSAATPLVLMRALFARAAELSNVELVSISTVGALDLQQPEVQRAFFMNSLFVSDNVRTAVNGPHGDYVPVFLSEIPRLFDGVLPLDVALLHVSPPDAHGYCSLGVSVDVARAAVRNAKVLIAQVNPRMPRTHGEGMVHSSRFAALVEVDEALPEVDYASAVGPVEERIGALCSALIEDGSTLQMGIGAIPDAILRGLKNHKDLGVHTEMLSDGLLPLLDSGVITGSHKRKYPGRVVTSFALGTRALYDRIDDKYAIQAFQANGIDYLLKPIELDAVKHALEKVELLKRRFGIDPGVLRELSGMRKPSFRERFMVASGGQIRSVPVEQVAYFQSEGRYVKLVSTDNHRYIVDGTMDKITSELDPRSFFRINRQLIVSFAAIKSMVPFSKSRVKVLLQPVPDVESIVSVERSAEFKAWLDR
jgi:hypothetical protein